MTRSQADVRTERGGGARRWLASATAPRPRAPARLREAIGSPLALTQAALLLAMTAVVATSLWKDHPWLGWLLVAVTVVVWAPELARAGARRWWFAYVCGIFVYTILRSYADETAIPIQTAYVIDADRALFGGTNPVTWLQGQWFSPARTSVADVAAVALHWSFFVAPHAGAVAVFLWRRALFARYVLAVAGTMYAGLVLFFAVPTTPPWLASQQGALDGAFRVMDFVGGRVSGDTYASFYASLGEPNSVAAMPSIHMAVTFAMYLWSRTVWRRLSWVLLAYTAAMGAALVYLAEHYVLDLAVGMACAAVCYAVAVRFTRAAGAG